MVPNSAKRISFVNSLNTNHGLLVHLQKQEPGERTVLCIALPQLRVEIVYLLVSLLDLVLGCLRLDVEGVVELRLLDHDRAR